MLFLLISSIFSQSWKPFQNDELSNISYKYIKSITPVIFAELRGIDFYFQTYFSNDQISYDNNIEHLCRANNELFYIFIHFIDSKKPIVQAFSPVPSNLNLSTNGWKWKNITKFNQQESTLFKFLISQQFSEHLVKEIIAIRSRSDNGVLYQVTFKDKNDTLISILYSKPIVGQPSLSNIFYVSI